MHAFCKTIFCVQIDVTNITLPCFLFRNDAERLTLGLCRCRRLSAFQRLNFSGEIRLYHTYLPNYFKFSAATISAISSFNFHTHKDIKKQKQKTTKTAIIFNKTLCRHIFWRHLVIYTSTGKSTVHILQIPHVLFQQ